MKFHPQLKVIALAAATSLVLVACGGGGGGSGGSSDSAPPMADDPPAPPQSNVVDFGGTVSALVGEGSTTLPDGVSVDADSAPIEMEDYMWEIDDADVDESELDEVFSG